MANTKRSIPEASAATLLLVQRLSEATPGQTITYAELSNIAGGDVRKDNRASKRLHSARKITLREHKRLFGAIPNEGLKCLDDSGKLGAARADVSGIARKAKRAEKKLMSVDNYGALSAEERRRYNATLAQVNLAQMVATENAGKKLVAAESGETQKLTDPRDVLKTLMG
jgi:hypothetical protein